MSRRIPILVAFVTLFALPALDLLAAIAPVRSEIDGRDLGSMKWDKIVGSENVPVIAEKPSYTGGATLGRNAPGVVQVGSTYQGYQAKGSSTLTVPVKCWNSSSWFLPEYVSIRTATSHAYVQQVSRMGGGGDPTSPTFTWFADASSYLLDASLIMGNGADNLSWQIFEGGSGAGPSPTNPYGYLHALSNTTIDSTTSPSFSIASGVGCNRDSTVAFEVRWYAPKHNDSADFYIAHFDMYPGPKAPGATITNMTVAYAADWDIPTDSAGSFSNTAGFDVDRQLVYQRGARTAPNTNRYGGIAARRDDESPIPGGWTWSNSRSVYPVGGFENDTLWHNMQDVVAFSTIDSTVDQNCVLVIAKGATIGPSNHLKFSIIFAGQYKTTGSLAGLQSAVDKARKFICAHAIICEDFCTKCGDVDGSGIVNISDVVGLIGFIFNGLPVPGDCNYANGRGDANGDATVNVSDAVSLISFIFNGMPCPHCQGMSCW